ncbi:tail fiber protein, partial [Candidatus Pacearchaeota archaeon]|nr:tail fiber protein [Candidatus Pacearchaeota archaeon]
LESGYIIMWSGAIADIPPGWVLCDGNNGTPDLRNRFIIAAGDTYAVDDTGGNVNHNHDFTGDGHTHTLPGDGDLAAGANVSDTSTSDAVTGTTDNENGLPPYYALAFVMKT